jgi:hypothetical protein
MAPDTTPQAQPSAASRPPDLAPDTDADSPAIARAISHLKGVLVPGETLEAYAVERRFFALTRRRTIVAATTGRFIVMSRGLLGGFTPIDVRWQDVEDAHLHVGIVGADVTVRAMRREDLASVNQPAGLFGAAGLRKDQAERVYRVCQAQSQAWREKRRIRDLDELRAKSGGLQLGAAPVTGVGANSGAATSDDAVARLQKAKEMLSGGLITDAEYEAIKARVVDRL